MKDDKDVYVEPLTWVDIFMLALIVITMIGSGAYVLWHWLGDV